MFRKIHVPLILTLVVAATTVALASPPQGVIIRLNTIVPENSPWTSSLRSMAASWTKVTTDRVKLTIVPSGGTTEQQILRKIDIKGADAATLTIVGLATLDKSFNVFAIPFFFESDAELEHVQKKLTPLIEQRLQNAAPTKYHLVHWGNGGWVRLFSKAPLRSIADIKKTRLFTTAGDQEAVNWYQSQGFHAVPLSTAEMPKQLALSAGSIDAAPSPPVYAAALQMYRAAPYMLDVPLGPLTAATVVSERVWSQISAEDRVKITETAIAAEKAIAAAAPGLDRKYIDEMKKAKLTDVVLDAKELAAFKAEAERLIPTQRGTLVPADVFDLAMREREAFRKAKK